MDPHECVQKSRCGGEFIPIYFSRTRRGRLSASVAFRKTGLPFASLTGGRKLLLQMNKSISMMILGCFTASTFSLVESLSHLILAPLLSYRGL